MLGAGIDPRMFVQDYSGFARAGAIQGQGMAQLGADIGDIGKQFGEFKKQQAEQEKQVKSAELVAKAISDSFPSLAPMAQEAMFILGDKNNPLSDRLAAAQAIETSLKIGSGLLAEQQNAQLASQKMAMQMEEQQRSANEIAGIENIYRGDEVVQMGRTRSGQLIPIGEMIQNALPQDETLQPLSDDLLTEADENGVPFEMGVSMGDEPGVLPPKPGAQLGVGPRYRESTQQQQEIVLLSPAQVQDIIAKGGKVSGDVLPDGGVSNAKVTYQQPSGMSVRTTPEGGVEFVQGPGVGQTPKEQRVQEAQKRMGFENTRAITTSLAQAIPMIETELSSNPLIARGQATLATALPATEVGRINTMLETARVATSRESINALRNSSLTGSAGGTITEREWPKFENRMGKMEIGVDPKDLVNNSKLTGLNQFEAAHGTPEDVVKLLDSGKITQDVYDEYVKEYLLTRQNLQIPVQGIDVPGAEWSKLNPKLLEKSKEGNQVQSQASPEASGIMQRLQELRSRLSQ